MSKVAQTRRMKEALQEINDHSKLINDLSRGGPLSALCFSVAVYRIEKISRAALQESPTKDTSAIWKMMRWRSKK